MSGDLGQVLLSPLLDTMGEGVLVEDAEGRVVFANHRLTELCCRGELVGLSRSEVLAIEGERGRLSSGGWELAVLVKAVPLGDGSRLLVLELPLGRLLSDELVELGRFAALGRLIARVCHEVNNPLAGATGFAQLLTQRQLDERNHRAAERIFQELHRTSAILERFHALARHRHPERAAVDVADIVDGVVRLREHDLRVRAIQVRVEVPDGLLVWGDAVALGNALLWVLGNAEEAIEGAGEVRIAASAASDAVRLTVADTGAGLTPEAQQRTFEPLYTTKPGRLGLGLPLARWVVESHGGSVTIANTLPRGAQVTIQLPAAG